MFRSLRWPLFLSLVLAALALLASCGGSSDSGKGQSSAPAVAGPRIAIPEDSFDFGKVPLDKVVSHTFKIKNVGSEQLTLLGEPPVRAVQGC